MKVAAASNPTRHPLSGTTHLFNRSARHFYAGKTGMLLSVTLCLTLFYACEKMVEGRRQDIAVLLITSGQWQVENYLEGSAPITHLFEGYRFQFREDGTLSGYKDSLEVRGTWKGDLTNYSITSVFPTAGDPLKKLNGTWKIKDSGMDFVKAELQTAGATNFLQLGRY